MSFVSSLSPFLSLADVSWSTPDGHTVLSHLSIDFTRERAGIVGRNGVGKSTLLRLLSGALEPERGRIVRTGTIGTMRQIVQVSAGETIADLMDVGPALAVLKRAEAGTATLDELADADWTLEARVAEALAQVGLDMTPDARLVTLSGGQRTRVALAGAVFARPDFLLLDEPTNDLDLDSIAAVEAGLKAYDGALLVVSHDESFLDAIGVTRRYKLH